MKVLSCFWALSAGCVVLLTAAGCGAVAPKGQMFTEAEPGPWKGVGVLVLFDNDLLGNNRVTVRVENYPAHPDDFVRRFEMVDNRGQNVGERVFEFGAKPEETFILEPETKEVTVTVISTGRGKWKSAPREVPVPAKE